MTPDQLADWTPTRVLWQGGRLWVDWCHLGDRRFTDPFFEQTTNACMQHPFNLLFKRRTPLEELPALAAARPGLEPTGFIFHMSRCGSTLAAQMLAALPDSLVLSEPRPFDTLLLACCGDPSLPEAQRVEWLRAVVSVLGQPRAGGERHYFLKLTPPDILQLDLIRQAFPHVPWVFLYRDPVEVLVANLRSTSALMFPGSLPPELLRLEPEAVMQLGLEEYSARLLAAICRSAVEHAESAAAFVRYPEVAETFTERLTELFGISLTPEDRERLAQVSRWDAKSPTAPFAPDSEAKQRDASPRIRELAETWLTPLTARLDALRSMAQAPK